MMPWYKKIPCWLGKHDWVCTKEEWYDLSIMFTKRQHYKTCKFCNQSWITWRNF